MSKTGLGSFSVKEVRTNKQHVQRDMKCRRLEKHVNTNDDHDLVSEGDLDRHIKKSRAIIGKDPPGKPK